MNKNTVGCGCYELKILSLRLRFLGGSWVGGGWSLRFLARLSKYVSKACVISVDEVSGCVRGEGAPTSC